MRLSTLSPILLVSSLVVLGPACVVVDGGGDADEVGTSGDSQGGDVEPESGPWVYSDAGVSSSSCEFLDDGTNGVGSFSISDVGGGGFDVHPSDGTASFSCDLTGGGSFSCPERLQETIEEDGFDAQIDVHVEVEGSLSSSTSMSGEQHGRIECQGADCGLAEMVLGGSFPCEFELPFNAVAD